MIKRTLKFTLCAALLAAGASVYADVVLKDNTSISWADFVNAINNPATVEGNIETDLAETNSLRTALNRAKTTLDQKKTASYTAQATVTTDSTDVVTATATWNTKTQEASTAATELATAKKNYSDANKAYNAALRDQSVARDSVSNRQKLLSQANTNVANKQAEIANKRSDIAAKNSEITAKQSAIATQKSAISKIFDDQIAAKQNQINTNINTNIPNAEKERDRYLRLRNALVKKVPKKVTAPWLVTAQDDAAIIRTSFKPKGTANDLVLYYKAVISNSVSYDDEDNEIYTTTRTLMISFDPQDGWYSNPVATAFTDIRSKYPNSAETPGIANSTTIDRVEIYLGYTDGKPNYGKNSILTITPNVQYQNVGEKIADAIDAINPDNYQVDSKTEFEEVTSDPELYTEYNNSYEEYKTLAETTLPTQNTTLQTEISNLETKKAAALGENPDTSDMSDELKELVEGLQTLNTDLGNLNTELGNLNTELGNLTTELGTLQGKVTACQAKLDEFQDELDEDTQTVNIYTGTKTPEGVDCIVDGEAVSYLDYLLHLQDEADAAKTAADQAATTAYNAMNTASSALSDSRLVLRSAKAEQDTAQAAYDNALDAAQEAANAVASAEAQKKYNDVTLNGDVTAETMIDGSYLGTIDGNGYVITVTADNAFNEFTGNLMNAGINGNFTKVPGKGHYVNVAVWTGSAGRWYDEEASTPAENYTTLGALGFAARDYFGVVFGATAEESSVAKKADDTKVYSLSVYGEDVQATPTPYYAVYKNDALVTTNAQTVTIPVNRFAKSATDDIAACTGLANVFYEVKGADNKVKNYSENVVITDDTNTKPSFYCPVEITAKNLSYSRSFSRGYNAACLPFPMSQSYSSNIIGVCRFDNLDMSKDAFSFTSAEPELSIAANTPLLVVANEDFTFDFNYSEGLTLQATPIRNDNELILSTDPVTVNGYTSTSFGTFQGCNAGTFWGESQSGNIYGLVTKGANKGKFQKAAATAKFSPFRMTIGSTWEGPKGANAEAQSVRGIIILNSLGVDITDELMGQVSGVENVSDASSLNIVGGQGAIEFIADADYGKVEVYNVNGGLVTVANVMEGTTRVNVEKGIYIVRGKKVMVK